MSMTAELIERLKGMASSEGLYDDRNPSKRAKTLGEAIETINLLSEKLHAANMERSSAHYHNGWILCDERMPEMHEEKGILRKFVKQRSGTVIISIRGKDGKNVVDSKCELWDGKWHSDIIRWLDASHCEYEVIAWMPLPESYTESAGLCTARHGNAGK